MENLSAYSSSLGNTIEQRFGDLKYQFKLHNHVITCTPANLIKVITYLRDDWNFIMLLDICGVDNLKRNNITDNHGKRFECVYHLLNMENHQRLRIKVPLDPNESVPSIKRLWKTADWFEKEIWDMFGITFDGQKKERLLTHQEFVGHPLRKDYKVDQNQPLSESQEIHFDPDPKITPDEAELRKWINIGPSHPATHGTLRIMLELEGETIRRTKLEIGYLHRCFEKICEDKMYNQIIPYTDRLNYCSAAMNNIGWCKAVETMMGIEIPDRAKALRMVVAELSRVIDHFLCIGTSAVDAGAISNFWFCFEHRERIYELFEKLCGARLTVSLTRIGGMANDLPIGWVTDCLEVVKKIENSLFEIDKMLTKSKIWMERTRVCPVSAKDAIDWGYTGPCLRASGVNYDIRKVSPYYFYRDVDFEIPLGINGDCYDRYLVRMEEIRQSLKIVSQVLDNLPSGDISVKNNAVTLPEKKSVYSNIESLMSHFMLIMKGVKPDAAEIYSATEAANGELGFYIISDGDSRPYRVKVRPPCYPIYQSFPHVVKNSFLSDAISTLGSMNVISGELDR